MDGLVSTVGLSQRYWTKNVALVALKMTVKENCKFDMTELSVIIPGKNEIFMRQTIENVLANIRGDTEIIAVFDGYWPDPPVKDHPKINIIHHTVSVGQRAATNEGARLSKSKFLMKLDAHCAVDEGFDVKLLAPYKSGELSTDVTTVPRLYNLFAFNWICKKCGEKIYQGPRPEKCTKCECQIFEMDIVWKPKMNTRMDFMRFDKDLKFQYWREYEKRPESKGNICDLMSFLGAFWVTSRHRFAKLGGLDENHGSWGQLGTEVSLKNWLSGGRLVVNKTTWCSHMFRTKGGKDWGFPYEITGKDVDIARKRSKYLWFENKWKKQILPLSWLIDKFWPIPDWTDEAKAKITKKGISFTNSCID